MVSVSLVLRQTDLLIEFWRDSCKLLLPLGLLLTALATPWYSSHRRRARRHQNASSSWRPMNQQHLFLATTTSSSTRPRFLKTPTTRANLIDDQSRLTLDSPAIISPKSRFFAPKGPHQGLRALKRPPSITLECDVFALGPADCQPEVSAGLISALTSKRVLYQLRSTWDRNHML